MFRRFGQLLSKKLQKVAHFVRKHKKKLIWPKLASIGAITMFRRFCQLFRKKLQKVAHFVKEGPKMIDMVKTFNFSRKLPCFGVLVNFSAKSCKKFVIS